MDCYFSTSCSTAAVVPSICHFETANSIGHLLLVHLRLPLIGLMVLGSSPNKEWLSKEKKKICINYFPWVNWMACLQSSLIKLVLVIYSWLIPRASSKKQARTSSHLRSFTTPKLAINDPGFPDNTFLLLILWLTALMQWNFTFSKIEERVDQVLVQWFHKRITIAVLQVCLYLISHPSGMIVI